MSAAYNIKKLRQYLCISQTKFAKAISVTTPTISAYENGRRQPSYNTVEKIIRLAKKHNFELKFDDIRADGVKEKI